MYYDPAGEDYMNDAVEFVSCRPTKKKKLLNFVPENSIVLAEFSFIVQAQADFVSDSQDKQVSLLVNDETDKIELILEISSAASKLFKNYAIIESPSDFPWIAINDLLSRTFIWILEDSDGLNTGVISMKVAILKERTPITKASNVVKLFTRKNYPKYTVNMRQNVDCIEAFFKEMQPYQNRNNHLLDIDVQHIKLKPTLCPYQARAVKWMLQRESPDLLPQDTEWQVSLMDTFYCSSGTPIFYNKYSQVLFVEQLESPPFPRGGILADEMGLGKTVAVIALILNNPRTMSSEMETDEFLVPLAEDTVKKVCPIRIRRKDSDPDFEVSARNMENNLAPKEELVLSKATKGSAMKRALNKWYELTLAEYSASSPSKIPKTSNNSIKCLCGDSSSKKKDHYVECKVCKQLQHASCVGFKDNYPYFCPLCWSKQKLVKSNATLIVSPPNIYHQWLEEINKHVVEGTFSNGIFMYDNIKTNFIQPFVLASYDIVICTYSRLRAELNRALPNESSRKLRNEQRFLKQCSPLAQVHWWRLCLDEAQMVEADGSAITHMLKLISASNRWSVTGTPIHKSVNDIYYLMDFLRIEPYTDKSLWNSLLYTPYVCGNTVPLCSTVSKIFWRNSKQDVSNELFIPKQTVRYHLLKFTAVEQNFYMREHTTSSYEFAEGLRRAELDIRTTIDSLDKTVLTRILDPLLNLRQACSHPLAVKGNKISTKTGSMTLTDLFRYLYNKTKIECEEELRKYIAALNGMAGIFCIEENWTNAVEYYRQVLQVTEEYKEKVHVDTLQRIHTLTNLDEILQCYGKEMPPTLHDNSLKTDAMELEEKYMAKASGNLKTDQALMLELAEKVGEMEHNFHSHPEVWWVRIISTLTVDNAIEEVIDKVSAELLANQTENKKSIEVFLSKISSAKAIEVQVTNWLKAVRDNRAKVLQRLRSLIEMSSDDLVCQAVDCHLRSNYSHAKKSKCELCVCENDLLDYECCLFAVTRKILKEEYEKVLDGAQTKGSWKAHKAEKVLRVIINVSKNKPNTDKWALKDGKNHMTLIDIMKKEFKQLRVVWMSLNHHIQARDEVNMCKVRLRLRLPGEPLPPKPTKLNLREHNKSETIYIIQHHEIESQRLKLLAEIDIAKSEFTKKHGTLVYLGNLGKSENATPEPCPICKSGLDNEWCVLQCGHSFCIDCIRILLMRNYKPSITCPICREVTRSCNLSFIDLSGREENCDVKVVGEHSTKVEAVVRTLIELRGKEENVKVLIFSTWPVVLRVLAVALDENGITYRRMPGHNYQLHLKEFKDPNSNITALLLPISWGSKGLNLIEASHVFLIEPIMNPAEELQAIGRVHRIGQTKETVVHRFLVKGTVEEKIYSAVSSDKDKWNKKKVTLEDLRDLFDIKQNLLKTNELINAENVK